MPRIAPAQPPYEPQIAAALERIMPPGIEPLLLFRVMAQSPRVFTKMFAGGLLDKGPLPLRQRELIIARTTARLGCEYEWGVHIALFAQRAFLTAQEIAATANALPLDDSWPPSERALLRLVDDFIDHHAISDATWSSLAAHFDDQQILEAIALVGYYHSISFLCNGLDLPLESYAKRFPKPAVARPAKAAHAHTATVTWSRDSSRFTDGRYSRAHIWSFDGGASVPASSSPEVVRAPLSDPSAASPEEAYVASLASCHMLWFLDLAARAGHTVDRYSDRAVGHMQRRLDGREWVALVELAPEVHFCGQAPAAAAVEELHHRAHEECFLANSVRTEVRIHGTVRSSSPGRSSAVPDSPSNSETD